MSTNSKTMIPHLRACGNATELVVGGKPFLVLGGELHNSSSSNLVYMAPIWQKMIELNFNTVLAPISWELIEPIEGQFDFSLVDGLIEQARANELRLIFLWFGSWKNGMSSYIPGWVKRDTKRFPRVRLQSGKTVEVLSTFASSSYESDALAFRALMKHIREVDEAQSTVIMVQIENEVGILGDSRDRCTGAEDAFSGPVPQNVIDYLTSHTDTLEESVLESWKLNGFLQNGNWTEVFGKASSTDEYFMAYNYARYIDFVAAAGQTEYPLPLFVNAWLGGPPATPGDYPSGGPLPHTYDFWKAGAPHIDLFTPDIYSAEFGVWCSRFTSRGDALFIPEMNSREVGARNVFYAIGKHEAIGVSPFAVDGISDTAAAPLGQSYRVLRQLEPILHAHRGNNEITGVLLDENNPSEVVELNGYELTISLDEIFGSKSSVGFGIVIATGPNEFIGAGSGFRVSFRPIISGYEKTGIEFVDEGTFQDTEWVPGRRLNGDENDQGQYWRFSPSRLAISRCRTYDWD